jgi:hypothetical protein
MSKSVPPWLERAARTIHEKAGYAASATEVARVLAENAANVRLPEHIGLGGVMDDLLSAGLLRREQIRPLSQPKSRDGAEYRVFERWIRKDASPVHVALSLRPNSYISHGSAAQHHGLLPVDTGRIYVNKEQSPKPQSEGALSQDAIDRAFSNEARVSNYVYGFRKTEIVLLNGKNSENYNVAKSSGKLGADIPAASLERTLVDIAVRPVYAGGIDAVLSAFVAARDRASVPEVVAALKKLHYVYPYHQAIGFYLARAGFEKTAMAPLKKLAIDFNFYLGNRMRQPVLDETWRVFYPKALDKSAGKKRVLLT